MLGIPNKEDGRKDPFDGEYVGNIWGWRFSLLGLALIVLMAGLMAYRHLALGVPFGEPSATEAPAAPDTLGQRDVHPATDPAN